MSKGRFLQYGGQLSLIHISKEAIRTGANIRDLILRDKLLSEEELDQILNPYAMTEPGISGKESL